MLGKIIRVDNELVIVENKSGEYQTDIINYNVIFETISDNITQKIVGEIINVNPNFFSVLIVGEIKNNIFISGITKFPSVYSVCRFINKEELEFFVGSQDYMSKENLYLGESSLYNGYKVTAKINDLLNQHFIVVGNSGTGKSCCVARLLQNLFFYNNTLPINSHFVVFDIYGEYRNPFQKINEIENINSKFCTTNINTNTQDEVIFIPPYLLDVDDLTILLNVSDVTLLPVLDKALKYVKIFCSKKEIANTLKNSVIASCIIELLSSGRPINQLRDQIILTLSKYNTKELNLNSKIVQPGYTRTLRQCLQIDSSGRIGAIGFVIDYLNSFIKNDISLNSETNIVYSLNDLYYALEFALLSEGVLNNELLYEKLNILKIRLYSIISCEKINYFRFQSNYVSLEEFVKNMFVKNNNQNVQILDMNFNYIDESFAKVLTKLYMRIFFKFATSLKKKGSFPINIIIEEAHRYVRNDNDVNVIGYNIFDRITKEGRKYGIILGFITQRPSELSTTCLSQCSNFFVYQIMHPEDLNVISSMSSSISDLYLEKIKNLNIGNALVFGSAFKMPLQIKLDLPDPAPSSSNVSLAAAWYK